MLADLTEEQYQELLERLKAVVDPPPAPIIEGSKGFLFIYGPNTFSVCIYGECRYREKGRPYKDIKIFAIGDEEIVVHGPFKHYKLFLNDIGATEAIELLEETILESSVYDTNNIER